MESLFRPQKFALLVLLMCVFVTWHALIQETSRRDVPCRCTTQHAELQNVTQRSITADITSETNPHPFRHDNVECAMSTITDRAVLEEKLGNGTTRKCTPKIFRKYFSKRNKFYGDGFWFVPKEDEPERSMFYPADCEFDLWTIEPTRLAQCLAKKRYKKITIFGDSNGFKQFNMVLKYFVERSIKCDRLKLQGDIGYGKPGPHFSVPGSPTMATFKGCWECRSQIQRCRGVDVGPEATEETQNESTVILEYIGMGRILNRNRPIFPKDGSPLMEHMILEDTTVMEFLMQQYFQYRGYPDLWLFAAPMHHEAAMSTMEELKKDLQDLKRLVNTYVPPTTDLVFLTNIRTCSTKSGWEELYTFYAAHNETKNEVMHKMNQVLFDVFREDFLKRDGNVHGFLDFGDLTCPLTCLWHFDGAHMEEGWYSVVFQQLLAYLCKA